MAIRDLSYEALAEATATDWTTGRGELNAALASIRAEMPDVNDDELALEITYRAKLYRHVFPEISLTPTALAKHWRRLIEEANRSQGQNLTAPASECSTCGGHRFVVVGTRPAVVTIWMKQHGIKPKEQHEHEEWAPCPDCHTAVNTSYRLLDGRPFQVMDPSGVRDILAR